MSITKTFAQGKLRLPDVLNSVSVAGLQHLYNGLFPMARQTKVTVASRPLPQPQQCPECKTELGAANEVYSRIAVCDHCGYHFVWSAFNRVEHLADPGSFRPIGRRIQPMDFLGFVDEHPYATKLISGQKQTGLSDAILRGRCRIGGTETILAVLDFHFMGGSMGSVVGEQITAAFEYATRHRLPVVTVVNSGGARMQEGIISLMQMPKTAAAVQRFHASGLLYLSILASPTTRGVFTSFASLGDVNLARQPDRPTGRDYIRHLSPNFLELQGDRCYGDDPTVVAGLGNIDGRTVIFVGQERRRGAQDGHGGEIQTRPRPEGYRKAIRMMDLAAQLHCPLVTFVDTSGADPGDESERHGIAWSLAHCLSTMSSLPVPIVTAIIGEGASGGAVAFAVADHILMLLWSCRRFSITCFMPLLNSSEFLCNSYLLAATASSGIMDGSNEGSI